MRIVRVSALGEGQRKRAGDGDKRAGDGDKRAGDGDEAW